MHKLLRMVTSVRLNCHIYYSDWQDIARVRLVSDFPRTIGKKKEIKRKTMAMMPGKTQIPQATAGLYSVYKLGAFPSYLLLFTRLPLIQVQNTISAWFWQRAHQRGNVDFGGSPRNKQLSWLRYECFQNATVVSRICIYHI